jgi:hypothetical protein
VFGSKDAGIPIVRFVILLEFGREPAVNSPLVWRPTPDWEYQRAFAWQLCMDVADALDRRPSLQAWSARLCQRHA